ncbi:hypothetical protein ElyMa_003986600 [Elysia marginata]|uniref:Uncharacterized protein n=1 Tax=Elysia marginata TaxID=1093978 RepID=A0AAV4FXQ8_9GAST|nr:hypothetical protein ElyMa_003986600 [Elysia marginata]
MKIKPCWLDDVKDELADFSSNVITSGGISNNTEGSGYSNHSDTWCPPDVTLEHGQEVIISYDNFTASKGSGRLIKCMMAVRSSNYSSIIVVNLKKGRYYSWPLGVATFDPADPNEVPLDHQQLTSLGEHSFRHAALQIDVVFFYDGLKKYDFEFVLTLEKGTNKSTKWITTKISPLLKYDEVIGNLIFI